MSLRTLNQRRATLTADGESAASNLRSPRKPLPRAVVALLSALLLTAGVRDLRAESEPTPRDVAARLRDAASERKLAYKLTEPREVEAILGPPISIDTGNDGDMRLLHADYAGAKAIYGRMRDEAAPFTLLYITAKDPEGSATNTGPLPGGYEIDIGRNRQVVLRNADDLNKLGAFWGLAGVSLANCDLREHGKRLSLMGFDSRTIWPPPERMPTSFDPAVLLENGKNPGLGVRKLHAKGIDGRGVRMAIIDQPMKPTHGEFAAGIETYKEIGIPWNIEPQMHGPPVASIAIGKTCGTAPRAALAYYAVPMWNLDNQPYCQVIETILKKNRDLKPSERIRVVSISTGMFSHSANLERWRKVVKRAHDEGLLLVTCAQDVLRFGTLTRTPGKDADDPASYTAAKYVPGPEALLVPTGGRTTASHFGDDLYTYWADGGLSWAAPYLAGLTTLAWQVDPTIPPTTITTMLRATARQTRAGWIVDPEGFIDAVQRRRDGKGG